MTIKLEIDALRKKWYTIDSQTVLDNLETSEDGLSAQEAAARLEKFGYNKLPEQKKPGFMRRFFIHFHNVLIYILIVAAIITALMDHWIDTWVILSVVIINALIGYIQENKAEKALESIRHMLSLHAAVFRDGKRKDLGAEDLVPGDIVFMSSGDKIPADVRILQANSFKVEEAALTGESEAVTKNPAPVSEDATLGDRKCMAYSGTTVRYGNATGVVVATGSFTELGKINTMISETEEMTTPLIRKINSFGKWLSAVIVVLAAVFFAFGYFARDYDLSELFLAVIGLAVAAIPEGLPAILTITLAIGVQRMARRNAIIRKLPSVETLGSVTVICSDKTGTLTRNEMTARLLFTSSGQFQVDGVGYAPEGKITKEGTEVDLKSDPVLSRFMQTVFLCNNAQVSKNDNGSWEMDGAPTEGALKTLAYKAGISDDGANRLHTIPFDSEYKYMATLNQVGDKHFIFTNGAPDRLLDICEMQLTVQGEETLDRDYWEKQIEAGARRGQRMLGSAFRQVEPSLQEIDHSDLRKGLVFLGLVGIIDPPRPEAIAAIRECKEAGIKVKMITGDHAITAMTIGKEMGIGDGEKAISGAELEKMDDIKMREVVQEYDIFARTSPEHKLRLVRALQHNGDICAMTGDGVNDAPALKQADIGIAMGIKGTEVTKDAASMVLADDNFASIVNAVEEGRTIYDNLRKTLLFLLPTNGAEALVLIAAILIGMSMPITPAQILWVNMVTAVTLTLALSFEPMEYNTMKLPPRDTKESMLGTYFIWRIFFVSFIIGGLTFLTYISLKNGGYQLDAVRTAAVNTLVAGQMFYLFNCRKIHEPALGRGFFENKIAFLVSGILIILQLIFTYAPFMNRMFSTEPLMPQLWIYPAAAGLAVFTLVELEKVIVNAFMVKKKIETPIDINLS